jgi:hypothetical protein
MNHSRNCLSYWFPKLEATGVPVPQTTMLELGEQESSDLARVLDGKKSVWLDEVVKFIKECAGELGLPLFLRTGRGSAKHEWRNTCYLCDAAQAAYNVLALVEWSHTVDMLGLPHNVWVCRKMLDVNPLFRCEAYGGMPVVREWRFFFRDGTFVCCHPYWPTEALARGRPDVPSWRSALRTLHADPPPCADNCAWEAAVVFDGYWSIDVLEARFGYYVTDMAVGEQSWHWPGCTASPKTGG